MRTTSGARCRADGPGRRNCRGRWLYRSQRVGYRNDLMSKAFRYGVVNWSSIVQRVLAVWSYTPDMNRV
jgi:hypothetical protein